MNSCSCIGIIDIGSNSIRLVIYEINAEGAYRVVTECKESARLSERIGSNGVLPNEDILSIVPILTHFRRLCESRDTVSIRAVATAAIRNAGNSEEIVRMLRQETGLEIEVLSGKEEARFGFLGVINTIDVEDGFIVDIGGGSTEVTLFRNRKLLESISFPFGSVNTTRQLMSNETGADAALLSIKHMVEQAMGRHPWISSNPGLPLIGLGGTVRSLGKMSQKKRKYSLSLAHNYKLKPDDLDFFITYLPTLPVEKRRKMEGLSKNRADIIVPGLVILHTIFRIAGAVNCIISGSGLRDGLFFETTRPDRPVVDHVLTHSVRNLLTLHSSSAWRHVEQVSLLSVRLFDELAPIHGLGVEARRCLSNAALLYRIGVNINYYQFSRHTQYLISQSRVDGLSHREIALCSLIASYKTKSLTRQILLAHKDILEESDENVITLLGILLRLAIALDAGEIQLIREMTVSLTPKELHLSLDSESYPFIELREIEALSKDFQKAWGLKLKVQAAGFSMK